MAPKSHGSPQFPALLLVQRQVSVARALSRLLENYYRQVTLVESPHAAEEALIRQGHAPTHLVCGEFFGATQPLGHDLIASWRTRFPSIERAVLATGADGMSFPMLGVDGLYLKPAPLEQLLNLLGVHRVRALDEHSNTNIPHIIETETKMKTKTPQAHQVTTLKERLSQSSKQDKQQPGQLRTAQGFASA